MPKRLIAAAIVALGLIAVLAWSQQRHEPLKVSGYIEADEIRIGSRVGGRVARVRIQAMQFAFLFMLPSVLLSGFVFPREEMPLPLYWLSFAIPVTYFVEILRGIVLRGADLIDLFPQAIGLVTCCVIVLSVSVTRFRKQLA